MFGEKTQANKNIWQILHLVREHRDRKAFIRHCCGRIYPWWQQLAEH